MVSPWCRSLWQLDAQSTNRPSIFPENRGAPSLDFTSARRRRPDSPEKSRQYGVCPGHRGRCEGRLHLSALGACCPLPATLAGGIGLQHERIEPIRTAGLLHDVGKIGISDAILLKPGKLTTEEATEMERHSLLGSDIIAGAGMPEIARWVLHLHERFDGTGYPSGLAGNEIPLESRVLLAADALEAMTRRASTEKRFPLPMLSSS